MLPLSRQSLYQLISATFCVIVVISNIISAKMILLPFGFSIPAGLLTYPLTFLLSDLTIEIYGEKKAKFMIYVAFFLNIISYALIQTSLLLPALSTKEQLAFKAVLGLSGVRIFSSLASFLAAQIVDIQVYALIRKWTGAKFLWLRNNGSTLVSQLVDTLLIDILYLYWGIGMEFSQVLPIMGFSYIYKAFFSIASTPFFYLLVAIAKARITITPKKEVLA